MKVTIFDKETGLGKNAFKQYESFGLEYVDICDGEVYTCSDYELPNDFDEYALSVYNQQQNKTVEILQFVDLGSTKIGQEIQIPNKKAFWKVVSRNNGFTRIEYRGKSKALSNNWKVLQKPFENL